MRHTAAGGAPPREIKFASADLTDVAADGTFSGYASLFGKPDLSRDVVLPGAFKESLARRGAADVKLLYQHDPTQPIGVWLEAREDARGLFMAGRLAVEVPRARDVLQLMRVGALDGLSIGFRTVKARFDRAQNVRQLLHVDLWEVSVVTFPMHPGARITAVKDVRLAATLRRAQALFRAPSVSPRTSQKDGR